jgi:hypothetical protein
VNDLLSLALSASDPAVWASAKEDAVNAAAEAAERAKAEGVDASRVDAEGGPGVPITTTAEALNAVRPGLGAYIEGLDLVTSYPAGRYAPAVRSKGFINDDLYGVRKAREIFAEGKAAFTATDSGDLKEFSERNAAQAKYLTLLPVKLPYATFGLPDVSEERILNRCIPLQVTHSFAVNGRFSPEQQKAALDFVRWFIEKEHASDGSLENSVRAYFERGETLPYAPNEETLRPYAETLQKRGFAEYLADNKWDAVHKENLLNFMFTAWYED